MVSTNPATWPKGSPFTCLWEGHKPNEQDLEQILTDHQAWLDWKIDLDSDPGRPPHDLSFSDLRESNLIQAKLQEACLQGADLQNAQLMNADLKKADLRAAHMTAANLMFANMSEAILSGANFVEADLAETKLIRAKTMGSVVILHNIEDATRFSAAIGEIDIIITNNTKDITYCASDKRANLYGKILKNDLSRAKLFNANLAYAVLYKCIFRGAKIAKANLCNTNLARTDFNGADLRDANLSKASLLGSDLKCSNLMNANLVGARLEYSDIKNANLLSADLSDANVRAIKFNRKTKFLGARLATCYGSPKFVSFARHQEYLEEMGLHWCGRIKRCFWRVLADCGRTIWNWLFWSLFLVVGFACLFYFLNQKSCAFEIHDGLCNDFHTMLYYSVVTFTTLGFGDITPVTRGAAYLVMTEVIIGYIMLGGLISIFATKLARRF